MRWSDVGSVLREQRQRHVIGGEMIAARVPVSSELRCAAGKLAS